MCSMFNVMDRGIECEEGGLVEKQTCMCRNTEARFNIDIRTHTRIHTTDTHTNGIMKVPVSF